MHSADSNNWWQWVLMPRISSVGDTKEYKYSQLLLLSIITGSALHDSFWIPHQQWEEMGKTEHFQSVTLWCFFILTWMCSATDDNIKQTSKTRWNTANRCHFLCLYCGLDITSFWNDVQKCNRTENGSDEVELSHRLAGMKTTQYKNKNNPEKSN